MIYRRKGNGYETIHPLSFSGVTVPRSFQFNISSPKWAHWFIHPHDARFLKAACFHDYALLQLDWNRPKAAILWWRLTPDVPLFKRIVTTIVLAAWPGKDK